MSKEFNGLCKSITGKGVTATIQGQGNFELETHGDWNGNLFIESSEDNGKTWNAVKMLVSRNDHNISLGREILHETMIRVRAFEWTNGTCELVMQFSDLCLP